MLGLYPFQFPLLGFLLCISLAGRDVATSTTLLSIPFIGIFALHPNSTSGPMPF